MQSTGSSIIVPIQLKIAGRLLLIQLILALVLLFTSERTGISIFTIQLAMYLLNALACVFLGLAARKLDRSWVLFGLLPAIGMLIVFSSSSLFFLWRAVRLLQLDRSNT